MGPDHFGMNGSRSDLRRAISITLDQGIASIAKQSKAWEEAIHAPGCRASDGRKRQTARVSVVGLPQRSVS